MKDQTVILVRRFFPAAPQRGDWEFLGPVAGGTAQHWRALAHLYRVLILAEPGAGKTFEARDQARKLAEEGKKAFFIRIEKLNSAFNTAFEIGTAEAFESWLASTEEAWFFLDSVDEAQLETPRSFEDAIQSSVPASAWRVSERMSISPAGKMPGKLCPIGASLSSTCRT